eukprot:834734-Prymnesium_polylepis.1
MQVPWTLGAPIRPQGPGRPALLCPLVADVPLACLALTNGCHRLLHACQARLSQRRGRLRT